MPSLSWSVSVLNEICYFEARSNSETSSETLVTIPGEDGASSLEVEAFVGEKRLQVRAE